MEFKLPELGEGVHEGEFVKWRVKPGDVVKHDQPLCEIMTDKATIEIPSAFEGVVATLHAKEGEIVKVAQVLLRFEGADSRVVTKASSDAKPVEARKSAAAGAVAMPAAGADLGVAASPATRKMAREAGIDLTRVAASGPHGRILREDVQKFISGGGYGTTSLSPAPQARAQTTPRPAPRGIPEGGEERIPLHGLRKKIAERMRLSKDHAAHYTYVEEADATELVKLRNHAKEVGGRQGIKVTYLPFLMKAMVAALRHYPLLNATLDEQAGQIICKHFYNIGLSIQTEDGLTAPVIKNVEFKPVLQVAKEIQELVERARKKQLTLDDFHGGTITLTNAGSIGGLFATPIINYPEVAILGFNKIFRKPVVKVIDGKEQIVIRDWTYFSISLDHRVVDGAVAAQFMKLFVEYIENPGFLLLD